MDYLAQKFLPWGIPEDATKRDYLSTLPSEVLSRIIPLLSVNTLGRVAQLSRFFYGLATPALYKKDARSKWPLSILWAALYIPTTEATEKFLKKIFDLAVTYDGNVNRIYQLCDSASFTPLHLAAANGNGVAVEKLLQLGADPNALAQYLLSNPKLSTRRKDLESRMPNNSITIVSRHSKWRPLFIPFLKEDKKIIRLLLKYDASPVLAVPIEDTSASAVDQGTINILHILCARQREKFIDDVGLKRYFRKYPELNNVPMRAGLTPLFFSLDCGNEIAFREIMANGGNIEDMDQTGRTPLMQAIIHYCSNKDEDEDVRQRYKEIIEYMIETCNAKVGNFGDVGVMETPLICAIKAIPMPLPADCKHIIQRVREIIDLLVGHGADINEISNAGFTLHHFLGNIICKTLQTGPLFDLFESLVKKGANLNIPSHNARSVLGICITKYGCRPTKFYNHLRESGASLIAQEVDAVFAEWAKSHYFRKSFDIIPYKDHVTQPAIDAAYEIAFAGDKELFGLLKKDFPKTTIAERVVSDALLTSENYSKPFEFALELRCFNAGYIHTNGNSLLHSIVDRLENYPKYKDTQAKTDAYRMLLRGAPLEIEDSQGKTALHKLMDLRKERDCESLRLFLHDVKADLEIMFKEAARQGNHKELSWEEWGDILESSL
ncbi:ankyrin repeat-containing domain protein [Trichoderma sp. SZMC 28011]